MIKQKPFTRYHEEKVRDSFTVNLNPKERRLLEIGKAYFKNDQDSAVIKALAWMGINEIQSEKTKRNDFIKYDQWRKAIQRGDI